MAAFCLATAKHSEGEKGRERGGTTGNEAKEGSREEEAREEEAMKKTRRRGRQ